MIPALVAAVTAAAQLYSDYQEREADKASKEAGRTFLNSQSKLSDRDYDKILGDIKSYYAKRGSLGTEQDVADYKAAMAGYDPESFVYNAGPFGYSKTRDDFVNPNYDRIIKDTTDQVQHSAAGAGLGRGSGAAESIADAVVKKNEQLYKDAQEMYESDRNFEYQKWADYNKYMQEMLNQKRAATDTKLAMQGDLAKDYYSVMDARQADLLKAQQDKMGMATAYTMAMSNIY